MWKFLSFRSFKAGIVAKIAFLESGFTGDFYSYSFHVLGSSDQVRIIYSRDEGMRKAFAKKHGIFKWTTSIEESCW